MDQQPKKYSLRARQGTSSERRSEPSSTQDFKTKVELAKTEYERASAKREEAKVKYDRALAESETAKTKYEDALAKREEAQVEYDRALAESETAKAKYEDTLAKSKGKGKGKSKRALDRGETSRTKGRRALPATETVEPQQPVCIDMQRFIAQFGQDVNTPEWLQDYLDFIKENQIVEVVLENWKMPGMPLRTSPEVLNQAYGKYDSFAPKLSDALSTVEKLTMRNCVLHAPMLIWLIGKLSLKELHCVKVSSDQSPNDYIYPNAPYRNGNPTLEKIIGDGLNILGFDQIPLVTSSLAKLKKFELINQLETSPFDLFRDFNSFIVSLPLLTHFTYGLVMGRKFRKSTSNYRFLLRGREHLRLVTLIESTEDDFEFTKEQISHDLNLQSQPDQIDHQGNRFTVFLVEGNFEIMLSLKTSLVKIANKARQLPLI